MRTRWVAALLVVHRRDEHVRVTSRRERCRDRQRRVGTQRVQRGADLHVEHVGALPRVGDLQDPGLAIGRPQQEVLVALALEPPLDLALEAERGARQPGDVAFVEPWRVGREHAGELVGHRMRYRGAGVVGGHAGEVCLAGELRVQGRVVEFAVAGVDRVLQLIGDDGERRDGRGRLGRGVLDDARVLAVQPDAEPRVERPVEHPLAVHLEDLRAGEPAEQRLADLRGVDA